LEAPRQNRGAFVSERFHSRRLRFARGFRAGDFCAHGTVMRACDFSHMGFGKPGVGSSARRRVAIKTGEIPMLTKTKIAVAVIVLAASATAASAQAIYPSYEPTGTVQSLWMSTPGRIASPGVLHYRPMRVPPNMVIENGQYIGQDPDPNVRLMLERDLSFR
jgi:hypothetical protein